MSIYISSARARPVCLSTPHHWYHIIYTSDCRVVRQPSARLVSSRPSFAEGVSQRKEKKNKNRERRILEAHEEYAAFLPSSSISSWCPRLWRTPDSTSQMMTPTMAATNARKKIQKHQQTIVRFFFLFCWRASHESL